MQETKKKKKKTISYHDLIKRTTIESTEKRNLMFWKYQPSGNALIFEMPYPS